MVFASSFLASCEAQSKLPKEMPPNAELIYVSEGGFVPSFFRILISGNTMKITDRPANVQTEQVWEAKLSDGEVKRLYQVFVDNEFDLSKPNKEINVPDGKSRSIELRFGQQRFYAVIGDGIKSAKDNTDRFHNVENAFGSLVKKYRK